MTPQQLKNSILQFAIQGKLVEQRADEGTAEELYQQIQEEKQKLIKEGKIKKEKPLPEITEDEIPFEIPESWKWERLGDIGSWSAGATPARSHPEYYGGEIPWLKTGDLTDSYVDAVSEYITKEALEKTSVRLNPVGAILMAMYGATIGKLGILTVPATTNQACCACICYKGVFNKYLFYYLQARKQAYIEQGAGGAQPNISKEKIINSIISLPPLAEQKRIVAKIEKLMNLVDEYKDSYEQLVELNKKFPSDIQKSILQYAIQGKLVEQRADEGTAEELYQQIQEEKQKLIKEGKIKKEKTLPEITDNEIPFEIPKSWKWVRLKEIVYNHGQKQPSSDFSYIEINSIDNAQQKLSKTETILSAKEAPSRARKIVKYGDILYSTVRPYLHNMCIIDKEFKIEPIASTGFAVMACVRGVNNKYLLYYLLSPEFDSYANDNENSKGVAYPAINDTKLYKAVIPLPPLVEQKRIVAKIEELMALSNQLKQ